MLIYILIEIFYNKYVKVFEFLFNVCFNYLE